MSVNLCTFNLPFTRHRYGTTVEEAEAYYKCVTYPTAGQATALDRGGFPMRTGNYDLLFTPDALRAGETETQGWIQFETSEYVLNLHPNLHRTCPLIIMSRLFHAVPVWMM